MFKGGVVLSFLTGGKRGYTKDIDFDLLNCQITEESLKSFVHEVDGSLLYPSIHVDYCFGEEIAMADYRGMRVTLRFHDRSSFFDLSADVGLFDKRFGKPPLRPFEIDFLNREIMVGLEANEQMIAEKLSTFSVYGTSNTRYKDFFDAYWLIKNTKHDDSKVKDALRAIVTIKRRAYKSYRQALIQLTKTLSDKALLLSIKSSSTNWVGLDVVEISSYLLIYLDSIG